MTRFTGSSIAVYGTLDAVKGGFQASIDGRQDQQKYNAYRQDYMADVPRTCASSEMLLWRHMFSDV
jgi:hypothetical protein